MMRVKTEYFRSRKHLQNVASLACQHCGLIGSTQASHSNAAQHGKGRAIKSSDEFAAALCAHHHHEIDQGRSLTRSERVKVWTDAYHSTVRELVRRGLWPMDVALPDLRAFDA